MQEIARKVGVVQMRLVVYLQSVLTNISDDLTRHGSNNFATLERSK